MKRLDLAELARQVASAPPTLRDWEIPAACDYRLLERQETILAEPAQPAANAPTTWPAAARSPCDVPWAAEPAQQRTPAQGSVNPIPLMDRQFTALAPVDYRRRMEEAEALAIAEEAAKDGELERLRNRARLLERVMHAVRTILRHLAPQLPRQQTLISQSLELLALALEEAQLPNRSGVSRSSEGKR